MSAEWMTPSSVLAQQDTPGTVPMMQRATSGAWVMGPENTDVNLDLHLGSQ